MNRTQVIAMVALALGLIVTSSRVQAQTYDNDTPAVGHSGGGDEFKDDGFKDKQFRVTGVRLRSGTSVDSIQFIYRDVEGPKHGGDGGEFHTFTIQADEYIGAVTVTSNNMVDSVKFHIYRKVGQTGVPKPPTERFGNESAESRTFTAARGYEIYGVHGRSGSKIDNLGFLVRPL